MSDEKFSIASTMTSKKSRTSRKKPEAPSEVPEKRPSAEDPADITIRLSDLGIFKRSPSELELQIQSERILYILEKGIAKLKLAVCLPRLLRRNACMLRRFLQDQEVEFIQNVSVKYGGGPEGGRRESYAKRSSFFQSISTVIDRIGVLESKKRATEKTTYMERDQDFFVDPHMAQVMEMMWNNVGLKEKVLAEFPLIEESPSTVLVGCVEDIKKAAQKKLSVTAIEERTRERHLRKAWKANAVTEENIAKIQQQLQKQREDLGRQLKINDATVEDYVLKIDQLKNKFKDDVKHKIHESEQEMAEDSHSSEQRQSDLAAESKATVQQFENLLNQHINREKALRAKRLKVETQLCSWLAKYDADIGERQAEFEEVTKGYEEEKAEMEALQEKFDEQEEEYVVLMAEKEAEEQRIWEERAYAFLCNRSARKIQRCWRAYRQRKIDRKKAKKAKAKAKKEKSVEATEGGGEGAESKPRSAGKSKKDGKNKKSGKDKKSKGKIKDKKEGPVEFRGADPMAALEKKFGGGALDDLTGEGFSKAEVVVDLSADAAGVTDVKME